MAEMKIVFSGLERSLEMVAGIPSVLQIANQTLFARVCSSLKSGEGTYACEPFAIWDVNKDEHEEIKPKNALMYIGDPFQLPWDDRNLTKVVLKRIEKSFLDDEDLRLAVNHLVSTLNSKLLLTEAELYAGYGFMEEWNLLKYFKAFGFGIDCQAHTALVDNLMDFVSFAMDARSQKILVFVNLKTFLTKTDLEKLYDHIFFAKTRVLLLENRICSDIVGRETKYTVDLDFLEY